MTQFEELSVLVDDSLDAAEAAAAEMGLSERAARRDKLAKAMLGDLPRFKRLAIAQGAQGWSTILFVDLRNSTKRAQTIGARKTYLTMHALLPALAYAVNAHDGYIVGFRGDGLVSAFGLNETGHNPQDMNQRVIVKNACSCGQWMIDAVREVVNPALEQRNCNGTLRLGVGVDAGAVIFTRIGLWNMDEVTAYGDAVNMASKICQVANDDVLVSKLVDELFPETEGGTTISQKVQNPAGLDVRRIVFAKPRLKAPERRARTGSVFG